jgi:hypothetical protein
MHLARVRRNRNCRIENSHHTKEDEMATATEVPVLNVQSSDNELAKQTVFIKVHLGLLGNTRKVNPSQVEVDADKALIKVSKTLLDSPELQAVRALDGDVRHSLYDMCLPFDVGIHLLPLCLVESVEEKLREFRDKRAELVESFLSAYPRLCREAAGRLRTLYNPTDYPHVDEVRSRFTFSWQYVSYGVPEQLREISARFFEEEREKAVVAMSEACTEIQQVMRASLLELVNHLRERLSDQADGKPQRLRESTVQKLRDFLATFDLRNVVDDQELKEQVEKARALLEGVSTDELRNMPLVRSWVREGMTQIATHMDVLVADRVSRKFRFDEA